MHNTQEFVEKELIFSQKYCARMAYYHQIAKDDVKMWTEKLEEIKERDLKKLEDQKIELEKKQLEVMNINLTPNEAISTQMV